MTMLAPITQTKYEFMISIKRGQQASHKQIASYSRADARVRYEQARVLLSSEDGSEHLAWIRQHVGKRGGKVVAVGALFKVTIRREQIA